MSNGIAEGPVPSTIARPTFDEVFLVFASKLAERATCHRLRVGCVITSDDHREVYGFGYNGTADGLPHGCDSPTPGACGCFVSGTLVRATEVQVAYRRWYEGDVVRVVTRGGDFSATPKHPVLAAGRGWVSVESLREGDCLLGPARAKGVAAVAPNNDHGVPIEQVFEAALVSGVMVRRAGARHHFHGDGSAHQDVDVVAIGRGLLSHSKTSALELGGKPRLAAPFAVAPTLRGSGPGSQLIAYVSGDHTGLDEAMPDDDHANSVTTSQRDGGLTGPVSLQQLRNGELDHGLSLVPAKVLGHMAQQATVPKAALHGRVRDAVKSSDVHDPFAGSVATSQVVTVERQRFSGHVYNLQTASNWYEIAGASVIAHNCVHAEDGAVSKCKASRRDPKIVYCTHLPCVACAKRFINLGGVQRVVYLHDYRLRHSLALFEACGIVVERYEGPGVFGG